MDDPISPAATAEMLMRNLLLLALRLHVVLQLPRRPEDRQPWELSVQRMTQAMADLSLVVQRLYGLAAEQRRAAIAAGQNDVRMGEAERGTPHNDVRMAPEGQEIRESDTRMPRKRGGQPGNANRLIHGARSKAAKTRRRSVRADLAMARKLIRTATERFGLPGPRG